MNDTKAKKCKRCGKALVALTVLINLHLTPFYCEHCEEMTHEHLPENRTVTQERYIPSISVSGTGTIDYQDIL